MLATGLTMPKLEYASLSDIRRAIQLHRVITFQSHGLQYEVEPHLLGIATRGEGFLVLGWVKGQDDGWKSFRFAMIRGMEITLETFYPRGGLSLHVFGVREVDTQAVR